MTVRWMCLTCGEGIEESAVDEHEAADHDVKAHVVPDRLLSNDPWQLGAESLTDSKTTEDS
ncbi:MAG: hypothetical protein ACQEQY_11720 [Halobacteriota archaeon]|uniref:hypothetical protein n=1 Tax=Halanaeroarchaeum sp. HSR-CO TaxID=2866382 RepID=UPI00217CC704|nr:hypothetical protein [Halanaeroarchaeum sp. HSR-CO]